MSAELFLITGNCEDNVVPIDVLTPNIPKVDAPSTKPVLTKPWKCKFVVYLVLLTKLINGALPCGNDNNGRP